METSFTTSTSNHPHWNSQSFVVFVLIVVVIIIIATDPDNGVYVFKPSGEYVTSFGLVSSGEIRDPSGVVVDEDGFVCVCGCLSGNVAGF